MCTQSPLQPQPLRHHSDEAHAPPHDETLPSTRPPFVGFLRADALVGEDARLLGAGRPHQRQHARNTLPAHVHAEAYFRHPQMGIAAHDAEVEGHGQRHAATDAEPFDRADRDLLHLLPG
ncbi:hypothetical protein E4T56_gene2540, partial [Termitomyces sp. T112]